MHEEVKASRERVSRRRLMSGGAGISLASLLASCASPDSDADSGRATQPTTAPTTAPPVTESTPSVVDRLDRTGTCELTSEATQGPYWFDVDSIRRNIREDRPGTPLRLVLRVRDENHDPLPDSVVELWHCDAGGIYSGYEVASRGGRGSGESEISDGSYSEGEVEAVPTDDGTYLRGAQVADARGIVEFDSIWPGWYVGRTVHIHLKVHKDRDAVLTSQLYFDDDLTDEVFTVEPYASHPGRDTRNSEDPIIDSTGMLEIEAQGEGYIGYLNLGVPIA